MRPKKKPPAFSLHCELLKDNNSTHCSVLPENTQNEQVHYAHLHLCGKNGTHARGGASHLTCFFIVGKFVLFSRQLLFGVSSEAHMTTKYTFAFSGLNLESLPSSQINYYFITLVNFIVSHSC